MPVLFITELRKQLTDPRENSFPRERPAHASTNRQVDMIRTTSMRPTQVDTVCLPRRPATIAQVRTTPDSEGLIVHLI